MIKKKSQKKSVLLKDQLVRNTAYLLPPTLYSRFLPVLASCLPSILHTYLSNVERDSFNIAFIIRTINLLNIIVHAKLLQLCPTRCDPVDCSPPDSMSMGFSRQEYWNGLPCPPPGDLPDPGIKPASLVSCIGRCVVYHQRHLRCPEYN